MLSPGILGVMKIDGLSEKQKMLLGELYNATDRELVVERQHAESQLALLNGSSDPVQRVALLRALLAAMGEETVIRSPFFCDYGYNVYLGRDVFLNFNCVLLDVMPIRIGDKTQIGPGVQIYAADHPRDHEKRLAGLECGKPVMVGRNVWIGGGAILLPGITVGDDAVIGAGSVVTRDVAPGVTVAGNPARLLRR
jgi:maltose O-acetyltransferase